MRGESPWKTVTTILVGAIALLLFLCLLPAWALLVVIASAISPLLGVVLFVGPLMAMAWLQSKL